MEKIDWDNLNSTLKFKFSEEYKIVNVKEVNEEIISWYQYIESKTFVKGLRYSSEEIKEKFNKYQSFLFFILDNNDPIATHLGYSLEGDDNIYYIDTLATIIQKKGLGKALLQFICEVAEKNGYSAVQLDTEEMNSKSQKLKDFYIRNGFEVIAIEGENLTMKKVF